MMNIYLAHPVSGLSYEDVANYYVGMSMLLKQAGYTILSPMTAKECLRTEKKLRAHGYDNPISTNHAIIERDRWMVCKADIVYVNLMNATDVSIGCMMELAWAHDRGKHTVVSVPEDNVHRHAFVLEAADIVFDNHEDAYDYLIQLWAL